MSLTNTEWLALLLLLVTTFYAWATFKILKANEAVVNAMQEQTKAQLRPYIVVSVSPRIGTTLLCLEIKNTGRSPATNLRLSIDRDFYMNGEMRIGNNISELPAFTSPIESLAPDTRLIFILGVGGTIFGSANDPSLCPSVFKVSAKYTYNDSIYSEESTLDLRPMLHSSVLHDPVAKELKRFRESLEKILKNR